MNAKIFATLVIGVFLLSACAPAAPQAPTPDIDAIRTSAAYTVVAEFTLTAAVFSPTPEPPTDTPTLEPATAAPTQNVVVAITAGPGTTTILCDAVSFDPGTVDVTIPDGTPMTAGQDFVKTWKIKNVGSCAWGAGYKLTYSYGEKMGGQAVPFGTLVPVGQEIEVSVNFKAPTKVGEYTSAWQMTNPRGIPFGKAIFVKIVVQ